VKSQMSGILIKIALVSTPSGLPFNHPVRPAPGVNVPIGNCTFYFSDRAVYIVTVNGPKMFGFSSALTVVLVQTTIFPHFGRFLCSEIDCLGAVVVA
jgi:hypothetical protein